jgi:hypothetical protein
MKKLTIFSLIVILLAGSALTGCYYDVEEELYGFCDSSNVTYSGTITGILNGYGCTGCHSGAGASGGVNLASHTTVKAAGDRIVGSINHAPGFSPMPQGGSKINQCDINKVQAWVAAGAPNN